MSIKREDYNNYMKAVDSITDISWNIDKGFAAIEAYSSDEVVNIVYPHLFGLAVDELILRASKQGQFDIVAWLADQEFEEEN